MVETTMIAGEDALINPTDDPLAFEETDDGGYRATDATALDAIDGEIDGRENNVAAANYADQGSFNPSEDYLFDASDFSTDGGFADDGSAGPSGTVTTTTSTSTSSTGPGSSGSSTSSGSVPSFVVDGARSGDGPGVGVIVAVVAAVAAVVLGVSS